MTCAGPLESTRGQSVILSHADDLKMFISPKTNEDVDYIERIRGNS